jgi:CHASE3 domain sensor protein
LLNSQRNYLKENIDTRNSKGLEFMVASHMFVKGKQNMDMIRALIGRIDDTENNLLGIRKKATEKASNFRPSYVIICGSVNIPVHYPVFVPLHSGHF